MTVRYSELEKRIGDDACCAAHGQIWIGQIVRYGEGFAVQDKAQMGLIPIHSQTDADRVFLETSMDFTTSDTGTATGHMQAAVMRRFRSVPDTQEYSPDGYRVFRP